MPACQYPSRALSVFVANENGYGSAPTTDSEWQQVRVDRENLDFDTVINKVDPAYQNDDMENDAPIATHETCTMNHQILLRGGTSPATVATTASPYPEIKASVKACAAYYTQPLASACATGDTTWASVADATIYQVGEIVMIDPSNTGTTYARQITTVEDDVNDGDRIRWTDALPVAVDSEGVIYTGFNIMPIDPEDGVACYTDSLAAQIATAEVNSRVRYYTLQGLVGKLSIPEVNANELIKLAFEMKGLTHDTGTVAEASVPVRVAGGASGVPATSPNALVNQGATMLIDGDTVQYLYRFGFDSGANLADSMDATQANGLNRPVYTEQDPTFTLTVANIPQDNATAELYDMYYSNTAGRIILWVGDATNGFALAMNNAYIEGEDFDDMADEDGKRAISATLKPKRWTESTSSDQITNDKHPSWCLTIFGKQS